MDDIRFGRFHINEAGFAVHSMPVGTPTGRLSATAQEHWPLAVIAATAMAVLLVFYHVVREAGRAADARHAVAMSLHRDRWQCNALLGTRARALCLHKLDATLAEPVTAMPDLATATAASH